MVVEEKRYARQFRQVRFVMFFGKQAAAVNMVTFADQFGKFVLQSGNLFREELLGQTYDKPVFYKAQ